MQLSSIDDVIKTLLPMVTLLPITVSPPRIDAPAYIITLFLIVGCLYLPAKLLAFSSDNAPRVTPW